MRQAHEKKEEDAATVTRQRKAGITRRICRQTERKAAGSVAEKIK